MEQTTHSILFLGANPAEADWFRDRLSAVGSADYTVEYTDDVVRAMTAMRSCKHGLFRLDEAVSGVNLLDVVARTTQQRDAPSCLSQSSTIRWPVAWPSRPAPPIDWPGST